MFDAETNLAAWKASRLVRLARLRRENRIGNRLHAKALKATVAVKKMDEGIALAFLAFAEEKDENDLVVCLHGLLASDPVIGEEPSMY
jgi:hypothetical protein